jgi:hypothetical protein
MSSDMNSGSAPDKMMLVLARTMSYWSSGMPIMSQMIFSGSLAATVATKSHGPVASRSSTTVTAARRTSSSNLAISRGLNARETIRRSRACRGSSMLIIDPKYSLNSTGRSGIWVAPRPEENTAGYLLASTTSAYLTRA